MTSLVLALANTAGCPMHVRQVSCASRRYRALGREVGCTASCVPTQVVRGPGADRARLTKRALPHPETVNLPVENGQQRTGAPAAAAALLPHQRGLT